MFQVPDCLSAWAVMQERLAARTFTVRIQTSASWRIVWVQGLPPTGWFKVRAGALMFKV
ncbi:MAG: hypothetical protein K9I85_09030 [Saprospiraceae bacterium]|nr:hypothetical protein [Saprospiraceae bacterium]